MTSGSQFRPAPPPALDSDAYAAAINEVKDLGRADSTTRTDEQTQIARFWNDGLGTAFAPGYWNRIAGQVATDQGLSLVQNARLFAMLNIATADALISCWDAKYTYNLWRPVTAIRAADTDGNPDTEADANWTPLLVTPNFPSYTSAHSTVSAAAAEVLTALFGAENSCSVGAEGVPYTRSFTSFDAAAEAGQSRIYGGIHYQFDNQAAHVSGRAVGRFVVANFLRPTEEEHEADSRHDDRSGEPRREEPSQPFGDEADNRRGDHTEGQAAFRPEGIAQPLARASNAFAANRGCSAGRTARRRLHSRGRCRHPSRPRCRPARRRTRTDPFNRRGHRIDRRRGPWTPGCSIRGCPAWMTACSRAPFRAMRPSPGPDEVTVRFVPRQSFRASGSPRWLLAQWLSEAVDAGIGFDPVRRLVIAATRRQEAGWAVPVAARGLGEPAPRCHHPKTPSGGGLAPAPGGHKTLGTPRRRPYTAKEWPPLRRVGPTDRAPTHLPGAAAARNLPPGRPFDPPAVRGFACAAVPRSSLPAAS
jgi:hypothetical protein